LTIAFSTELEMDFSLTFISCVMQG